MDENKKEDKTELIEAKDDESNEGFHAPWAALIVSGVIIILMIICIIVIVNVK